MRKSIDSGVPKGNHVQSESRLPSLKIQVCQTRNTSFTNLDEWLVALSKFTLNPDVLFDDHDLQDRCLQERKAMCAESKVTVRKLAVTSLRTYDLRSL